MSVNTGVSRSACQRLSILVFNVFAVGGHVFFGKTKVNDEDSVSVFTQTNREVVWFDVSVDDSS
jgi:hypothetical protein